MKNYLLTVLILSVICTPIHAQTYKVDNQSSSLEILGTSTLHDWEIKAENLKGTAQVPYADDEYAIESLQFEVLTESLKSGKNSMDNNTYEALKSDDFDKITYTLKEATILKKEGKTYEFDTKGSLTIAGFTKEISMPVKVAFNAANMTCIGTITFKMTDFKVDPPTALLGTVKTGDEVTIKFNTIYKK